jgi:hypothetical protein
MPEMEASHMILRQTGLCVAGAVLLAACAPTLRAQTAPAPTAYTVTSNNTMAGPVTVTKIYRLGSKVVVNERTPAPVTGGAMNIRTFYDLKKMEKLTWDPVNSSAACVKATFSGDWGDPFAGTGDLAKQGVKQVGAETIHGFAAKILEADAGDGGKMRVWVDTKTGMVVKAQLIPASGAPVTMIEVMDVSLTPPPASAFVIPANCAAVAPPTPTEAPRPPGEAEEAAALTGGYGQDFVNGIYGPGTKNSCTMVFRVVRAGTMAPISGGFQVAVDLNVASEPTPSYSIDFSREGHATFKGGGLHEITSPGSNGVFRVANVPAQFEMDIEFGNPGSATANLYRQCFAAQTVLLYVVKDPSNITKGGDWLWVKSGKYTTVPR